MADATYSFDLSRITAGDLLMASSLWEVQLALVIVYTAFWQFMLVGFLPKYIRAWLEGNPKVEHLIATWSAGMRKVMPIELPKDREFVLDIIVNFNGVYLQHGFGLSLCVLGVFFSPEVCATLVCHAALSEVGWELQDTLMRIKALLFDGEVGRRRNPPILLTMYAFHHTCAFFLVVPLNMYYRNDKFYHEALVLLQFAALSCGVCQQYGYTKDCAVPRERLQMRISVVVSLVSMVWTRLMRGTYLWYKLLDTLQNDGHVVFWRVAFVPIVGLTLFNMMIIIDCWNKFAKHVLRNELPTDPDKKKSASDEPAPTLLTRSSSNSKEKAA